MTKYYYVFNGQNASTGSANKVTGFMSYYGSVIKFDSKKEALEYVDDKWNGNDIITAGTKRKMRTFCLGMSVRNFEEYLNYIDTMYKDEEGIWATK